MEKSKIKNFILILLALVNVFLLSIVITNAMEEQKARSCRIQALENVLSENGIALASDIKLPDTVPPTLTLKRNLDMERRNLSSLIGSCSAADQGGNVYFYNGSDGQARFRGTGEFEILLYSGVITKGRDPVGTAKSALKKLGIESGDIEPQVTVDGEETTVILYCSWEGTTIYNVPVTISFNSDNSTIISGARPLDVKSEVQSSADYPDGVTILMGFLESISQTGSVCNEITGVKIEYNMYSAVSGNCTLKPVWCITTNSGSFYIDAETGKQENILGA